MTQAGAMLKANKTGTSQVGAISKAKTKSKGGPLGDKTNARKSCTVPQKTERVVPLHSSSFVGYVSKAQTPLE